MSIRSDLLAGVRAVIVAVTDATLAKVIVAGSPDGPRPTKPYLTVRLTTLGGGELGPAETVEGLTGAGVPVVTMRQRREASLSVQAFGEGAVDWIDQLHSDLDSPASLAAQEEAGLSLIFRSGPTDLSQVVDTSEEQRYLLELIVRYTYLGISQAQTELATVGSTLTLERSDGDPDTLDASQTISL